MSVGIDSNEQKVEQKELKITRFVGNLLSKLRETRKSSVTSSAP